MSNIDSEWKANCCGADCNYKYLTKDNPNEPCWGICAILDEECTEDYSDCWWIHGCEGHQNGYKGPYVPKRT